MLGSVLQEWGKFYNVELCVAPLRDLRTPRGVRCDVEIVDGSHHRRGGDMVDANASTSSFQESGSHEDIAIARLGRQSNPWDRPGKEHRCHRKTGRSSDL